MKRTMIMLACGVLLVSAQRSYAGALGIPLDAFLATFKTWVVGLGLIMGAGRSCGVRGIAL